MSGLVTQPSADGLDLDGKALMNLFLAGRPDSTRAAYQGDLDAFAADLGAAGPASAIEILIRRGAGPANAIAVAYRAHLIACGLAPASINRRLATLRSLILLAGRVGVIAWQLEIGNVRARAYRDTHGPGDRGIRQLLNVAAAQPNPIKARRDVALIRLLHDLALRRGEVCQLDVADVDVARGRLAVMGKGQLERVIVALPTPTREALGGWLEIRGCDPGPLLLGLGGAGRLRYGARLSGPGLWSIVRELSRRADLTAWPHGLRHTAITRALEATGGDLRKVQRFSRHRDVRAVLTYDDNRADLAGEIAAMVAAPSEAEPADNR